MKRIYDPSGDVTYGGVVIHDYAITKLMIDILRRILCP